MPTKMQTSLELGV